MSWKPRNDPSQLVSKCGGGCELTSELVSKLCMETERLRTLRNLASSKGVPFKMSISPVRDPEITCQRNEHCSVRDPASSQANPLVQNGTAGHSPLIKCPPLAPLQRGKSFMSGAIFSLCGPSFPAARAKEPASWFPKKGLETENFELLGFHDSGFHDTGVYCKD